MKKLTLILTSLALTILAPIAARAGESKAAPAAPRRTVYAWFPKDVNNLDTRALDWSAITHLSFRAVVIQPDGTIRESQPGARVKKLVDEAHRHGVRVSVLVWGTTPAQSSEYLARNQDKAVRSLVDYVAANNLDGLDMDDETWRKENTVTGGPNRELVTQFFRRLTQALKAARADRQVFWASPPVISPQDRFADAWPDYKTIAEMIDGLCIMSYCMCPPSIGWTGSAQPVRGGGKVGAHARDYATCIQDYLDATGGRKDKLLLGIAVDRGGTEWTAKTDRPLAPIVGRPRKLSPQEARENAAKHGRRFDPEQHAPWYCYPKDGQWVQGWYEDDDSLAAKLKLARDLGIRGVCLWVLDGAAEPRSTFELIHRQLHGDK